MFADETATGAVLWALDDEQGTIRDWAEYNSGTNTTTVTDHLKYDSFGRITSQSNGSHTVVYAFTGREWDKDVDLQYNRMRWYDPVVGRWISEDPIGFAGGDANLVRYVGNNATNLEDPSGLIPGDGDDWGINGGAGGNWGSNPKGRNRGGSPQKLRHHTGDTWYNWWRFYNEGLLGGWRNGYWNGLNPWSPNQPPPIDGFDRAIRNGQKGAIIVAGGATIAAGGLAAAPAIGCAGGAAANAVARTAIGRVIIAQAGNPLVHNAVHYGLKGGLGAIQHGGGVGDFLNGAAEGVITGGTPVGGMGPRGRPGGGVIGGDLGPQQPRQNPPRNRQQQGNTVAEPDPAPGPAPNGGSGSSTTNVNSPGGLSTPAPADPTATERKRRPKQEEYGPPKPHGNTAGRQQATLYELYDKDGNFLKHGVSQDPNRRYTKKELDGGYLIEIETGPRDEMLKKERDRVETRPGPWNREPWAGRRLGE